MVRLKIALIMTGLGSVIHISRRMAVILAEMGHQVDIFTQRRVLEESTEVHEGVRYVAPPTWFNMMCGGKDIEPGDVLFRSWKLLARKYDVIHVVNAHRPAALIPCLLAKFLRGSLLVDEWWEWFGREGVCAYRGGGLKKLMSWYDESMELPSKRFYDVVLPITQTLAERIPDHPNCHVLHGAKDAALESGQSVAEARQVVGLDKELFIIGMSNVEEWDHADNRAFFEAAAKACRKHPDLRLLFTGDQKFIQDVILKMLPPEQVIAMGWMPFDEYQAYLSACNLFVLPYPDNPRNRGRWPNKFGDYIALQRPVLTNPTGDVGVMMDRYNLGFLCEPEAEEYLRQIDRVCAEPDIVSPNQFGFNRVPVDELMDFNERINRFVDLYQHAMS